MRESLALAERGRGTGPVPTRWSARSSSPTRGSSSAAAPTAVAGGPHAEVIALEDAGERARGATLYCTLEPCSHTGRTGPCAPLVSRAGIRRAVIAIAGPEPAGRRSRAPAPARPRDRDGRRRRAGGRGPAERRLSHQHPSRAAARHAEGCGQPGRAARGARAPHAADRIGGGPPRPSPAGRSGRHRSRIRHDPRRRSAADGARRVSGPAADAGDFRPPAADPLVRAGALDARRRAGHNRVWRARRRLRPRGHRSHRSRRPNPRPAGRRIRHGAAAP